MDQYFERSRAELEYIEQLYGLNKVTPLPPIPSTN